MLINHSILRAKTKFASASVSIALCIATVFTTFKEEL